MGDIKIGNSSITLKLGSSDVTAAYLGSTLVYSGGTPPVPTQHNYFTIRSLSDGNLIYMTNAALSTVGQTSFSYSIDSGLTWEFVSVPIGQTVYFTSLDNGETIMFKGYNIRLGNNYNYGHYFRADGDFEVEGNIMTLLSDDDTSTEFSGGTYNFAMLFSGCTNLVNAENLVMPASALTEGCYNNMFRNCTALAKAPKELPATEMTNGCYGSMFEGCTSLSQPPSVLSATTFHTNCWHRMFCMSRTSSVQSQMTYTPKMYGSYNSVSFATQMFCGNNSLNTVECYITRDSGDFNQKNWMNYTNSTGTFKKLSTQNFASDINGIPAGWTIVDV